MLPGSNPASTQAGSTPKSPSLLIPAKPSVCMCETVSMNHAVAVSRYHCHSTPNWRGEYIDKLTQSDIGGSSFEAALATPTGSVESAAIVAFLERRKAIFSKTTVSAAALDTYGRYDKSTSQLVLSGYVA